MLSDLEIQRLFENIQIRIDPPIGGIGAFLIWLALCADQLLCYFGQLLTSSRRAVEFVKQFNTHSNTSNKLTLETGCLLFTSWMVYYLLVLSQETQGVMDTIVTIFFMFGALTFFANASGMFDGITGNWIKYLKTKYLLMALSFLPGLYFAFKYDYFLSPFYRVVHLGMMIHFLFTRVSIEFESVSFAMGILMSVGIYVIDQITQGVNAGGFGSGLFVNNLASLLGTSVHLSVAAVFLFDLPGKFLPNDMMFGVAIAKYSVYFVSLQSWYILMVFATWNNIGAGANAFVETCKVKLPPTKPEPQIAHEETRRPFGWF